MEKYGVESVSEDQRRALSEAKASLADLKDSLDKTAAESSDDQRLASVYRLETTISELERSLAE